MKLIKDDGLVIIADLLLCCCWFVVIVVVVVVAVVVKNARLFNLYTSALKHNYCLAASFKPIYHIYPLLANYSIVYNYQPILVVKINPVKVVIMNYSLP